MEHSAALSLPGMASTRTNLYATTTVAALGYLQKNAAFKNLLRAERKQKYMKILLSVKCVTNQCR